MKKVVLACCLVLIAIITRADNGYRLWLRYDVVGNKPLLAKYQKQFTSLVFDGNSSTVAVAVQELSVGLKGLLGSDLPRINKPVNGSIVAGTPATSKFIVALKLAALTDLGSEGYLIKTQNTGTQRSFVIAANTDIGVLYGVFQFLRLIQMQQNLDNINFASAPKIKLRLLNHWDNLNRSVERGYAGSSIWDWHRLPDYIDQRYIDYARANASIGINGTVLTNVNANALILSKEYLVKAAALANTMRPYGIKVYLTARFCSPIELGKLKTADPLDKDVQAWWKTKVDEIYSYIPDFGGFLIKANSEGQPGPQNYARTHADGANMLADAVAPHKGIVIWRAFVYSNETPDDRFKQAYNEFKPLDGKFKKNVLVQVKNGPIDFQPREPFHPLFGAMPQTPLMMEFQITQEYLGQATSLVFLPSMFAEVLNAKTYYKGAPSPVASIIEGRDDNQELSGISGVANIGSDLNWTGHPFGQANWYGFGRLAWNPSITPGEIAEEWVRQTFGNDGAAVQDITRIMLASHQIIVNYMTPLGLHHIMGYGHHYGPAPWYDKGSRADWNPVYYHKADNKGLGFDRTGSGSNALAQYMPQVRKQFEDSTTCPDEFLLWFHHVSWNHKMRSGRSLWEELCFKYNQGVDSVRWIKRTWDAQRNFIDDQRYSQVAMLLTMQEKEAVWWRNACPLYFQTFSKMAIPEQYEKPDHTLDYYEALRFPYAPGNG